jgi:exodeoxyribonuclease-3
VRIATWNVNSIRARHERVHAWLGAKNVEVLCLQELKVADDQFPTDAYRELGYEIALHGQKGYNGVAILARGRLHEVTRGFADGGDDSQARFVSAWTDGGVRVLCLYVPNGEMASSPKYDFKLAWLHRLRVYLETALKSADPIVVCGDFNIAPTDLDVYDPVVFRNRVLATPVERSAYEKLLDLGLTDVARKLYPTEHMFTWWEYGPYPFKKDQGLRIDHILANAAMLARLRGVSVDRETRAGKGTSDHAPLVAEFAD